MQLLYKKQVLGDVLGGPREDVNACKPWYIMLKMTIRDAQIKASHHLDGTRGLQEGTLELNEAVNDFPQGCQKARDALEDLHTS